MIFHDPTVVVNDCIGVTSWYVGRLIAVVFVEGAVERFDELLLEPGVGCAAGN